MPDPETQAEPLTGDQYMALLLQRQAEHVASNPPDPRATWAAVPLLEWFIRPGDEDLFTPPTPEPQPKRETTPRTYRSAESLREERDRLVAQRGPLGMPLINDRAAAGGVGLGVRRGARVQQREDSRLRRYVALTRRIDALTHRILLAEARETR